MLELKERLVKISEYRNANFFSADSIGVIGRGPSVYRLDLCYKKFNHCYLTGEFNHTLHKIEKYINGKKIVLCVMQPNRYRTTEKNCQKFNINNLQVQCQDGTKGYKKCVSKFPDLKVSGFTKKHYDIVKKINPNGNLTIFSTGMSGILSALYFNPKNIYVIGFDFYNKNVKRYFVKEDKDIPGIKEIERSIKGLREGMIESIHNICDNFKDTNLYLYTTYKGIKSKNNLHVTYV